MTAIFACSAQGDQADTGLGNNGDDGNGGAGGTIPANGGTVPTANGGAIPVSGTGSGAAAGTGGTQGGIQCQGTGARLKAVLRDFQPAGSGTPAGITGHPDFEPHNTKPSALSFYSAVETGIVQRMIDPNSRKPLYAGPAGGTNTTMGPEYFPSWFQDTPGVNMTIDYYLEFMDAGNGLYVFDQAPFLPVSDGERCPVMPQTPCLLGNSWNYMFLNNYALTLEFHTKFVYKPGLSFRFAGDDDVWVFVNGQLAIDLGGIHQRAEATLNLDAHGLTVGQEYILDFFWAERHVTASNFRVETSLDFINCSIDVPK